MRLPVLRFTIITVIVLNFETHLFPRSEIAFRAGCRQRPDEFHAPLTERREHMIVPRDFYLETVRMPERTFDLPAVSATRYATSHLAPAYGRVRRIVVQKLAPLHQQHGVVFGRRIHVLRERDAHLSCARQRRSIGRPRPRRINTCVCESVAC